MLSGCASGGDGGTGEGRLNGDGRTKTRVCTKLGGWQRRQSVGANARPGRTVRCGAQCRSGEMGEFARPCARQPISLADDRQPKPSFLKSTNSHSDGTPGPRQSLPASTLCDVGLLMCAITQSVARESTAYRHFQGDGPFRPPCDTCDSEYFASSAFLRMTWLAIISTATEADPLWTQISHNAGYDGHTSERHHDLRIQDGDLQCMPFAGRFT